VPSGFSVRIAQTVGRHGAGVPYGFSVRIAQTVGRHGAGVPYGFSVRIAQTVGRHGAAVLYGFSVRIAHCGATGAGSLFVVSRDTRRRALHAEDGSTPLKSGD
jgi:hypothetical protein